MNGPARNSSGAVVADSWKRGADGVEKLPCLSNYRRKPKHDKHHRFANIPSSSPHLPMGRFAQPCRHARLRGQLARSRLLQPQRGGKPALPQPSARRSTPPRHQPQPPSSPTREPRQRGGRLTAGRRRKNKNIEAFLTHNVVR